MIVVLLDGTDTAVFRRIADVSISSAGSTSLRVRSMLPFLAECNARFHKAFSSSVSNFNWTASFSLVTLQNHSFFSLLRKIAYGSVVSIRSSSGSAPSTLALIEAPLRFNAILGIWSPRRKISENFASKA